MEESFELNEYIAKALRLNDKVKCIHKYRDYILSLWANGESQVEKIRQNSSNDKNAHK